MLAGQLTAVKASVVNNSILNQICTDHLGLSDLILSAGVLDTSRTDGALDSRGVETMRAGVVEALIGAIYLDTGLETAASFTHAHILPEAFELASRHVVADPISTFQMRIQETLKIAPVYKVLEQRKPSKGSHYFKVGVYVAEEVGKRLPCLLCRSCLRTFLTGVFASAHIVHICT